MKINNKEEINYQKALVTGIIHAGSALMAGSGAQNGVAQVRKQTQNTLNSFNKANNPARYAKLSNRLSTTTNMLNSPAMRASAVRTTLNMVIPNNIEFYAYYSTSWN